MQLSRHNFYISLSATFLALFSGAALAEDTIQQQVGMLRLIWQKAEAEQVGTAARHRALSEYLKQSRFAFDLPSDNRSLPGIMTLRVAAAYELNRRRDVWEAGQLMVKLGLDKSENSLIQKSMAMLKLTGLLNPENPEAQRYAADKEAGRNLTDDDQKQIDELRAAAAEVLKATNDSKDNQQTKDMGRSLLERTSQVSQMVAREPIAWAAFALGAIAANDQMAAVGSADQLRQFPQEVIDSEPAAIDAIVKLKALGWYEPGLKAKLEAEAARLQVENEQKQKQAAAELHRQQFPFDGEFSGENISATITTDSNGVTHCALTRRGRTYNFSGTSKDGVLNLRSFEGHVEVRTWGNDLTISEGSKTINLTRSN